MCDLYFRQRNPFGEYPEPEKALDYCYVFSGFDRPFSFMRDERASSIPKPNIKAIHYILPNSSNPIDESTKDHISLN